MAQPLCQGARAALGDGGEGHNDPQIAGAEWDVYLHHVSLRNNASSRFLQPRSSHLPHTRPSPPEENEAPRGTASPGGTVQLVRAADCEVTPLAEQCSLVYKLAEQRFLVEK